MFKKLSALPLTLVALLPALSAVAQDAPSREPAAAANTSDRIARVQGKNTSLIKPPPPKPAVQPTRSHQVVEGDTLWKISADSLSDPFLWPVLWSYNPQVTNPHWIYPGDTIYLEPKKNAENISTVVPEIQPEPQNLRLSATYVPGFYVSELPETRGHILYSDQEKHMISTGDEVQIDFVDIEMRKKIYNGQHLTVFLQSKPVKDSSGNDLAYKLIRHGVIEIIDARTDSLSTARVLQESREIERGMLIIPNDDLMFKTTVTPNAKSQEGRIIDAIDLNTQLASQQFVIINRGAQDGVVPGNRWVIFEQREGLGLLEKGDETQTQFSDQANAYKNDDDENDPRDGELYREDEQSWVLGHEVEMHQFPERDDLDDIYGDREYTTADLPLRKIGEVLVVDTHDKFCTGIIVESLREINLDTRVVMIKGY